MSRAESIASELLGSAAGDIVLQGDLHHENILAAHREPWLAIDPKGVIGEPAYEPGALLRNPMPTILTLPGLEALLAHRARLLSELLAIDRSRILAWAFVQAVLAACWDFEDHALGWEPWLVLARALERIG
ncbi:MAG: aminoglycoside phosphotransferase family protein [Longimicrobiales bacterium]